ncbi:hypothetical protein SAMN00120144_3637 [Hymenobacter roseosalivarius DSM 11622]|uniref:Uncharacterized protein n=1 Tax=Hymenobacter roseosalivarius DSM 11622 TaxID=645990 RepID=A0A1W1UIU7_9BACT|nr:hypothetical protein [Hymenobacter roseosalivarius]SMB80997.1 hypothetical protein SAMN00120144_3637 [Hymenobacter roseosalivarius DSM 11622]
MAIKPAATTPRPALDRYKNKPRPTLSENPAGTPPPVPVIEGLLDPPPGPLPAAALTPAPAAPGRAGEGSPVPSPEVPAQVPFNSQIRFETYLRIKQAQFYDRVKIKDLTDEALNYYLDQFEGANTALPPKVLQEVLNQGKIKGYKKRGN